VVEATEVETAEAPVLEATETAEATAVETDEIETAEAAVVEAEVDEAPVVEAIEAEAIEDESVTAEPDLAAAAEASEPAPVEAPVAEATEVPAAEAAVAAAAVKKEPASNRRWYVVHAYSGFESYVKKVLESRIATSEHKKKFGDIMVPTEEVVEMREGNRRKSERKFFPGYVLVQMEMDSDTWHLVKQVPKVLGFIGGTSDKPAPISEAEADAILNRVEEGVDKPRPKVLFEVGEVVRVNDGPFNDFNGVVEEVNYEKSKMLVSVQIFGRSTPVELAFGQVEKG
jgi:transcriptional antiterminator NusG